MDPHNPPNFAPQPSGVTRARQAFLRDRIILVTGAERGLGVPIARAACEVGATAVLAGLDQARLKHEAKQLMAEGLQSLFTQLDASDETQVREVFAGVHEQFGRLDVVVINSSAARFKPVVETTLDDWYFQVQMNLTSAFLCMREALRLMSYRREGQIIVLNTTAVKRPLPLPSAAYTATRAGLAALVDQLREEARPFGVRLTQLWLAAHEVAYWETGDPQIRRKDQLYDGNELARQIVMLCRGRTNTASEDVTLISMT